MDAAAFESPGFVVWVLAGVSLLVAEEKTLVAPVGADAGAVAAGGAFSAVGTDPRQHNAAPERTVQ